ncbi:MAG: prepilin-type N-terminal cleavage/methylation domain-containing protein [Flavipsychrobacter sp.]|nr:prepilin-type N-terminal cleavage/methylation domain-containing protein [Flavipsychrobacter sp.]
MNIDQDNRDKHLNILLPAFTLLEMIIAIIIGSIIITLIYGIFLQIDKTWRLYHKNQEQLNSLLILKKTLQNDLNNSLFAKTFDEKKIILVNDIDSISYTIDTLVIRNSATESDTFNITVSNCHTSFIKHLESQGIVDKILLDIDKPIEIKSVLFKKNYSSSELMNLYQIR